MSHFISVLSHYSFSGTNPVNSILIHVGTVLILVGRLIAFLRHSISTPGLAVQYGSPTSHAIRLY